MSVTIPVGFGQAAFIHTSSEGTEPFICTLGLDLTDAGGDFVEAANTAFSAWATTIMEIMDSDLQLVRVNLAVGVDGPAGSVDSNLTPVNGSRSGEGLPWSLSAIARKQTNQFGRRGRGRMFIPGVVSPSEIGQSGAISNTRRATIDSTLDDLWDNLTDGSVGFAIPPVILHSPGPGSTPFTSVTSFNCAPLVGWVRKRIR